MLSDSTIKQLEGIRTCSLSGHKVKDLYHIMVKQTDLWMRAYANIQGNKGALTKGINDDTLDGFSEERVEKIMKALREKAFKPKPVRRTYIPKANGKMRPLGIPCATDKLVQEVARILLNQIYEPVFSEYSHGFREGRSSHTAILQIMQKWRATKWMIEFDIKGYFDNIDHEVLIELLQKRIEDKRFINLLRKMLEAGYLDEWKFNRTYSGTPQGGVISPILANIYLHELDRFMEEKMLTYNNGKKRRTNPAWTKIRRKIESKSKTMDQTDDPSVRTQILKDLNGLNQEQHTVPGLDPMDSNFRRLRYCRYADDFVVGIVGPKADALKLKEEIEIFLQDRLKLELSSEKTKILHGKQKCDFLGFKITGENIVKLKKVSKGERVTTQRTTNANVRIIIPVEKLRKFAKAKDIGDLDALESTCRTYLIDSDPLEIFKTYNAELRGIMNYYAIANNAKGALNKLAFLYQASLAKTLAAKYKTTAQKIYRKFSFPGAKGLAYEYEGKGKIKVIRQVMTRDMPSRNTLIRELSKSVAERDPDAMPNTLMYTARTGLLDRLNAQRCEYCGKEGQAEVHHRRKMAGLNHKNQWEQVMIARRRKTMVLCSECHYNLHKGELPYKEQK